MTVNRLKILVGFLLVQFRCTSHAFLQQASVVPRRSRTTNSRNLVSSANESSNAIEDGDNDDDNFMKALRTRVEQVTDRDTKLPILLLDSMLPRQVLRLELRQTPDIQPLLELMKRRIAEENPCFGMVGTARLRTGQLFPLQHGVEVLLVGKPTVTAHGTVHIAFQATNRRMRITGEMDTTPQGWTEARVVFLDSSQEEAAEQEQHPQSPSTLARAQARAHEFTSPNMNMPEGKSLIDRWIELAKERELRPGQIDQVLQEIGEIPPAEQPSERAYWVGALINPLPGMGVALEIRPSLLMAKTAEERVTIALQGIFGSIKYMDGSAPLI